MARLSASDRALIRAAEAEIRRRYRPHWHELAAAVRTQDGRVVVGVHIDAYASVCAETAAIARAVSEGAEALETIVAVRYLPETDATEVVAPCGTCRELIADFGDVYVIHRDGRGLAKTRVERLLPSRYPARRAEHRRRGRSGHGRRGARGRGERGRR
jgi:cytidine deaminase